MKRFGEVLIGTGLATSVALGATACGDLQGTEPTQCVGLDFASPKGGPGSVEMYVFPKFNRNFGDARPMRLAGMVISGNDAGKKVTPDPQGPEGQFGFTWDSAVTSTQTALVQADVSFEGHNYACTPTRLRFDPRTYQVSPHLPGSPF